MADSCIYETSCYIKCSEFLTIRVTVCFSSTALKGIIQGSVIPEVSVWKHSCFISAYLHHLTSMQQYPHPSDINAQSTCQIMFKLSMFTLLHRLLEFVRSLSCETLSSEHCSATFIHPQQILIHQTQETAHHKMSPHKKGHENIHNHKYVHTYKYLSCKNTGI